MNISKKLLFCSLTTLVVIGTIFLASEIALRVLKIGYGNQPHESDPILHHRNPSNYTYLVHDPAGEFGGHYVYLDSQGRRYDPKINPVKESGFAEKRIAFLGDSFTYAREVSFEDSFVGLMSKHGRNLEVKNYGVATYSPILYLLQWRQKVNKFKPTHVFLLLYAVDVDDDRLYKKQAVYKEKKLVAVPGPSNDFWKRTLRQSYVARFIRRLTLLAEYKILRAQKDHSDKMEPRTQYTLNAFSSWLLFRIAKEVREAGAEFTLIAVPDEGRFFDKKETGINAFFSNSVKRWAEKNRVSFIDLVPSFEAAYEVGQLFYEKDGHFTEKAHRLVFEAIQSQYPQLFENAKWESV